MTDIVERLRGNQSWSHEDVTRLLDDAADKIERLHDDYSILKRDYDELRTEVEHLRTTLGYLADNINEPALVAVAEAALKPKP